MARIKPFKGLRPAPGLESRIPALPYDVMSSEEAREMVAANPDSFLHVTKPEVDLPKGLDLYSDDVYQCGKKNFLDFIKSGRMIQDDKDCYYVYRLTWRNVDQTGLVAGISIEDYENDIIKKHELTRADKEEDRLKHIQTLNANTGPVFLTYQAAPELDKLLFSLTSGTPMYDFGTDDGVYHRVWKVDDPQICAQLTQAFAAQKYLYVADGHHRSAAGTRAGALCRAANPHHTGDEEYNFFLGVIFPHHQLYIMDYNRIVKDLNGHSPAEFTKMVEEKFNIGPALPAAKSPDQRHEFSMYFQGAWHTLTPKAGSWNEKDPVQSLDVSILQNNLLAPILGIMDPRKDKRIDFVGGIRGLDELARRVDAGEAVAFALHATAIEELMSIADAGMIMPPKSTWFEPKLRCGMIVHLLD